MHQVFLGLIIHVLPQGIYAPEMLLDLTTPRVLIMEWVEGQRLSQAERVWRGALWLP